MPASGERAHGPLSLGGGEDGCILHCVENKRALNDGDMLLVDGYLSSISLSIRRL